MRRGVELGASESRSLAAEGAAGRALRSPVLRCWMAYRPIMPSPLYASATTAGRSRRPGRGATSCDSAPCSCSRCGILLWSRVMTSCRGMKPSSRPRIRRSLLASQESRLRGQRVPTAPMVPQEQREPVTLEVTTVSAFRCGSGEQGCVRPGRRRSQRVRAPRRRLSQRHHCRGEASFRRSEAFRAMQCQDHLGLPGRVGYGGHRRPRQQVDDTTVTDGFRAICATAGPGPWIALARTGSSRGSPRPACVPRSLPAAGRWLLGLNR